MIATTRKVNGDEVAAAVDQVWGLDEEGELTNMWRPCGYPNLWFTNGSFPYSRMYNRFLAIPILADLEGLARRKRSRPDLDQLKVEHR